MKRTLSRPRKPRAMTTRILVDDGECSARAFLRFAARIASQINASPKPITKEIKSWVFIRMKVDENHRRSSWGRGGKYQALHRETRRGVETKENRRRSRRLYLTYSQSTWKRLSRQKTRCLVWHAWRSLIVSRFSTKVERTVAGNKMRYLAMIGRIV